MSGSRLDELLPRCDAAERHEIDLPHPAAEVWNALERVDFARPAGVRLLMGLRAIPELVRHPGRLRSATRSARLADLEQIGFGRIAEEPGRALVLGVEGRFWRPTGNLEPFDADRFRSPVASGRARALWSFEARPIAQDRARLVTETRIVCGDPASRRKFRLYWLLVRPGSGLIRRWILSEIGRECGRAAAAAGIP